MKVDFPTWLPVPSPNMYRGRKQEVSGLVLHFTAAGSGRGTANYFAKKEVSWKETIPSSDGKTITVTRTAKVSASAHIVVDRDGTIYQCVSLEDRAWHAGPSKLWKGLPLKPGQNVNDWTIGIEIANWGRLETKQENGGFSYVNYLGNPYKGPPPFPWASKRLGRSFDYWEPYPEAQVAAVIQAAKVITGRFPNILRDSCVGHEDIDPGRKIDPGPAWPMERFLDEVFGDDDLVATELNKIEDDDRRGHYDEENEMCLVEPKEPT